MILLFLGIEVHRSSSSLLLSQQKYILYLLERSKMVGAKPISSLVEPGSRLCVGGDPFTDPYLYRSIGFGLCYVIITLPEIVYIVALVLLYDM